MPLRVLACLGLVWRELLRPVSKETKIKICAFRVMSTCINKYWTRLGKMAWFVSSEQVKKE